MDCRYPDYMDVNYVRPSLASGFRQSLPERRKKALQSAEASAEQVVHLRQRNQFRRLPVRIFVFYDDGSVNASTHIKFSTDTHEVGSYGFNNVIKDFIGDGFMECALIPECPHVQLKRLEFYAQCAGDVFDLDGGKIRLACFWAQAGELRHVDADRIITAWFWIVESFQIFAWLCCHCLLIYKEGVYQKKAL